uniref:Uncharacterized protein n=1 Tax=Podoviridae sp. ctZkC8 TaxID=2825259 RepID=A0A8S5UBQ4_9CAUD|nr:MAG TPA: hypothetical protein [Podoviridae sp. ctZkC8]
MIHVIALWSVFVLAIVVTGAAMLHVSREG